VKRSRRAAVSGFAICLAAMAGLALSPGAAWARDAVTATDPADGSALTAAPGDIDLNFSATPDPDYSHVSVRDASGAEVGSGDVSRAGQELRLPVSIGRAGVYTIAFHVTFVDGSDLIGVVRFSVGTGVAPPPADAAARRAAEAAVTGHTHDIDSLSASLLVVDAVVGIGVVIALFLRPRDRRSWRAFDDSGAG
jgi:methionine-rich copper-binding protein CopC